MKKVVDKRREMRYNKQAVAEREQRNGPWELKIEQYTDPEIPERETGEGNGLEGNSERNQVKKEKIKQLELVLTESNEL